jgi:hypothetical protein
VSSMIFTGSERVDGRTRGKKMNIVCGMRCVNVRAIGVARRKTSYVHSAASSLCGQHPRPSEDGLDVADCIGGCVGGFPTRVGMGNISVGKRIRDGLALAFVYPADVGRSRKALGWTWIPWVVSDSLASTSREA